MTLDCLKFVSLPFSLL